MRFTTLTRPHTSAATTSTGHRLTFAAKVIAPLGAAAALATACSSSGGGGSPPASSSSAGSGSSSSAAAATTAGTMLQLSHGHLSAGSGRTVYLFLADTGTTSKCSGACASAWPPVPATGHPTAGTGVKAADISTTTRSDGSKQLVYGGHPLYYFQDDTSPGDTNGQGINGFGAKWWEVDAAGKAITGSGDSSSSSSSSSGGGGGVNY